MRLIIFRADPERLFAEEGAHVPFGRYERHEIVSLLRVEENHLHDCTPSATLPHLGRRERQLRAKLL